MWVERKDLDFGKKFCKNVASAPLLFFDWGDIILEGGEDLEKQKPF
jgi:hypothetical protein